MLLTEQYSIAYIFHVFFIQSSIDGCLHCFHVLTNVHSAAVNMGVLIDISLRSLFHFLWINTQEWNWGVFIFDGRGKREGIFPSTT